MQLKIQSLALPLALSLLATATGAQGTLVEFSANTRAVSEDVNANFRLVEGKADAAQTAADNARNDATSALNQISPLTGALKVAEARVGIGASASSEEMLRVQNEGGGAFHVLRDPDPNFQDTQLITRSLAPANRGAQHRFQGAGGRIDIGQDASGNFVVQHNDTTRMTVLTSGNVGIGTTSPTERLHVSGGDLRIDTNSRLQFGSDAENTDQIEFIRTNQGNNSSVLRLNLGDDPDNAFTDFFAIVAGGETQFQFQSNGIAIKPNGGSWSSFSDSRLKRDIQPMENTLERLLELEGRTFYYQDPKSLCVAEGQQMGFVAQDVERVFPDWVTENEDGMKLVSITGFEALTVESLRELDTRNKELRAENEELRSRVAALEALAGRVAQLEQALQSAPAASAR